MWDPPIELQATALETMIREQENQKIMEVVRQIGVKIDKESLIEALNHDRKRYEEAYQKGWDDCRKQYEDQLTRIAEEAQGLIRGGFTNG